MALRVKNNRSSMKKGRLICYTNPQIWQHGIVKTTNGLQMMSRMVSQLVSQMASQMASQWFRDGLTMVLNYGLAMVERWFNNGAAFA